MNVFIVVDVPLPCPHTCKVQYTLTKIRKRKNNEKGIIISAHSVADSSSWSGESNGYNCSKPSCPGSPIKVKPGLTGYQLDGWPPGNLTWFNITANKVWISLLCILHYHVTQKLYVWQIHSTISITLYIPDNSLHFQTFLSLLPQKPHLDYLECLCYIDQCWSSRHVYPLGTYF